jgi:hypothetical protein
MAAFLNASERATLAYVSNYIRKSPSDKPVDQIIADQLKKLHTKFGFNGDISFLEALRDQPTKTLVDAIIYMSDHA